MNFRTTLILLASLVVVGAIALFVKSRSGEEPVFSAKEKTLLKMDSYDVTRLVVTPADGQRMVLEKADGKWKLAEPVKASADSFAVDQLVDAVTALKSRGSVELAGSESAATGLDQPRHMIEVTARDGKTAKVRVGNRLAVGGGLYVRIEGESAPQIVAADLADQLDKPASAYRQTRLIDQPMAPVRQIEIQRPDQPLLMLSKGGAEWQITAPAQMPAEASEVTNLTSALSSLAAVEFVEVGDVLPLLLPANNPRLTVRMSTAAPATQPATRPTTNPQTQPAGTVLQFGGYDTNLRKNVYVSVTDAGGSSTLAKVAASSLETFNKKPLDLRDRRVVTIDPKLVSQIAITPQPLSATQPATAKPVVLERKKSAPRPLGPELAATQPATNPATNPATRPTTMPATTQAATQPVLPPSDWVLKTTNQEASEAKVQELLEALNPLRATKYLEKPTSPTTQPAGTVYLLEVTTEAAGRATTHALRITDPGELKSLKGDYDQWLFELDRSLLASLTADYTNQPAPAEQ